MTRYEHTSFFPAEAFDNELSSEDDSKQHVFQSITRELTAARMQVIEAHDGVWDINHELSLAATIQEGLRAEEEMETTAEDKHELLQPIVDAGKQAKHDLVVANLPFAAYMARASVGRRHLPQVGTDGVPHVARYDGDYLGGLKDHGTYARIADLAHTRASLEDRVQVAMEAMWLAADKYTYQPETKKNAKFITYAAWWIQRCLSNESLQEMGGWDVNRTVYNQYMTQLNEARLHGTDLPENRHTIVGRGRHRGLSHMQMLEGRKSVPLATIKAEAPDEADIFDEPTLLSIDDLTQDDNMKVVSEVEEMMLQEQIAAVLETLSEREAGVIIMRFGFDDGRCKTLDEIGKVYGLTKDRVHQIESKALSKLRVSSRRREMLQGYQDSSNDLVARTALLTIADGSMDLKTGRIFASKPARRRNQSEVTDVNLPRDPSLESWQAYEGEGWDDPIRSDLV